MKKSVFVFLTVLCTILTHAQSIIPGVVTSADSFKVSFPWKGNLPTADTGSAQLEYKTCNSCTAFPGGNPTIFTGSDSVVTVWTAPHSGPYFFRMSLTVTDTLGVQNTLYTLWQADTISPIWVRPTIGFGTKQANMYGGIQNFNANPGNTTAIVDIYLDPYDSTYQTPHILLQSDTITGGAQIIPVSFNGLSDGSIEYPFSYTGSIRSLKGFDSTGIGYMITTLTPTLPYIQANPDSSAQTDSTLLLRYPVNTNGDTCIALLHFRKVGGIWDSIVVVHLGINPNATEVAGMFTGAQPDSAYQLFTSLRSSYGEVVTNVCLWKAPVVPQATLLTTTVANHAGVGKETIQGTAVAPHGAMTVVCAITDVHNTTYAMNGYTTQYSTPIQIAIPGVGYPTFTASGLVNGHTYRAMFYGNDTSGYSLQLGSNLPNAQVIFTYRDLVDSVLPTATLMVDQVMTNGALVSISGSAVSNLDSLAGFVLGDNGTYITLSANTPSHQYTGWAPNSVHHLSLQSFNQIPLYSIIDTVTVIAGDTSVAGIVANVNSIQNLVCYEDTSVGYDGWTWIDVYGSNFMPGALYTGTYVNSGYVDVHAINFISSTHIQVQVWTAYYDIADIFVTNPNSAPSNTVQTNIQLCTGINTLSNAIARIYPNPATDEVHIQMAYEKELSYTLYNMTGQKVQTGFLQTGENTISLTGMSSGIYFVELTDGVSKTTKKIVKQ